MRPNQKPHKYRDLTPDRYDELASNFLIDSWSYSKVDAFARNEKGFEMRYIYNMPQKSSSSAIAGNAYHEALRVFFSDLQRDHRNDIADLQAIAYAYIDDTPANRWKLQKTTPTVEEAQIAATKTVTTLLENFMAEIQTYTDEMRSVLHVEDYFDEFLTVNGVDIPLPCHGAMDLVIKTKDDRIVLIDHKSKTAYTDEKDIKFSIGKQAITYALGFEAKYGIRIQEVWFIENKISKNKDKSPQLQRNQIVLDQDTRRLYEVLLYEPLKRMLEATQDPDYIYLINESDNYIDKAEIYDFWARTLIAEVSDFMIEPGKEKLIEQRLKKIRDASLASISPQVIKKFRENASQFIQYDLTNKDMTRQQKIEHTLRTLGMIAQVAHTFSGYSSDTFLLELSAGTTMASIFKYKLDIANALGVPNVRIQKDLFVHKGKSYLAVEASKPRETNLMYDPGQMEDKDRIPVGFDNFGTKLVWDTTNPSTPHVLVCGSTGSGKSVFLNSTIEYAKLAGFDQIEIFDPKYEFMDFAGGQVSVYNDIDDIEAVMETLVEEMNARVKMGTKKKTLVIFDEFADAVANSKKGPALNIYEDKVDRIDKKGQPVYKRVLTGTKKSLEENLRILLQKGRSSGYRIVAATQRASVNVITGDAKVNFPVQICFKVPKEVDSKVVIDEAGGEALTGKGDGLLKSPEYGSVIRFQAFYRA